MTAIGSDSGAEDAWSAKALTSTREDLNPDGYVHVEDDFGRQGQRLEFLTHDTLSYSGSISDFSLSSEGHCLASEGAEGAWSAKAPTSPREDLNPDGYVHVEDDFGAFQPRGQRLEFLTHDTLSYSDSFSSEGQCFCSEGSKLSAKSDGNAAGDNECQATNAQESVMYTGHACEKWEEDRTQKELPSVALDAALGIPEKVISRPPARASSARGAAVQPSLGILSFFGCCQTSSAAAKGDDAEFPPGTPSFKELPPYLELELDLRPRCIPL